MFFNYVPVISKPTKTSKANAIIIDHINTNNFLETYIKAGILKIYISEHFTIFLISKTTRADKRSA